MLTHPKTKRYHFEMRKKIAIVRVAIFKPRVRNDDSYLN